MSAHIFVNRAHRPFAPFEAYSLQLLDRSFGLLLLLAAVPVAALAGVALTAISRRSPVVAHLRVGQFGQPFWMLKLRTMWTEEAPRSREKGWIERVISEPSGDGKDPDDHRVTSRFAGFCRRYSIDELPQLWHVIRGEMSLVGPRPLTRGEIVRHFGARADELLSRKPGLTGLWQVSGRSAIPFPQRAELDLQLVRSLTPSVYWKTLLRTIPALIQGRGAW